ncbi:MAG: fatty acid CoA ligase family protein [Gemmataceae bacterium]
MSSASFHVADHLVERAAAEPSRAAIHFPLRGVNPSGTSLHRTITFAELNADSDAIAAGLARSGIRPGMRTALMVPPSPDFFSLTFGLFKLGAVPVLIDPGMGVKNLGNCLAEAEPEAFIGIPKAHFARRLLRWAKRSIRITVNVGRRRFFCTASLEAIRQPSGGRQPLVSEERGTSVPRSDNEPAAILFTSGSTGVAKGAVYTQGIFAAQIELLRDTYGIRPGEVDLCTFPLFALFGPALGMTCVIPDMDASRPAKIDPRKAAAQMAQFGVTNLFGSPAVIRRLGELTNSKPFANLKRVISAGAPATAASVERLTKLLPDGVEIFTPYGATEALPVANIGSREILTDTRRLTEEGKGVCIGRPVKGIEVRVVAISDEPIAEWSEELILPPGTIGEFVVRGPVVTREYFHRPQATVLAKIRDPLTGDILHRMGDVGYIDDRGRMWFCGRKSHRVQTPHGTLFTDQVEPIFNLVPGVARTALVGWNSQPVVCVELADGPRDGAWPGILRDLLAQAARFEHTRGIATFLEYPTTFPVDVRHNSKIFREKLAAWARVALGRNREPADNRSP